MRRPRPPVRGRGLFSGTGLIIVCLAATMCALLYPVWSYTDRPPAGVDVLGSQTVPTRYGPLSGLDRDFVTKVRLAGLWELPAAQQARHKGTTQAVRTAGEHLVEGHTRLDAMVRAVTARLGLVPPDGPDAQQRSWLEELDAARGTDYDRRFADVLRLAHGRMFPLAAQVRAGTRNSLVRDLADVAITTELDHIRVLEATGDVDFEALARELNGAGTPPAVTHFPVPLDPTTGPAGGVPTAPGPGASPSYPLPPATSSPPP
ncbi:DUF4142 domain-containing protein [Streptomyces sp. NPDC059378]|uniref:DUF4142 domain-containing protein n=1 Tax=Streptomyces sp. NPDC059378 TaxID=3346815 RepID=UPI003691DCF4